MSNKFFKNMFFCLFTFLSSLAFSQTDSLKIEGEIHFKKSGDIFILLVDEETFKIPLTGIKKQILKITEKNVKVKKVSYKFEGIKPGIYGIRCFQDVNGNGKLDKGMFGPKEPWGMTWQEKKPATFPKFKHIAFKVDSSISDLRIYLNK